MVSVQVYLTILLLSEFRIDKIYEISKSNIKNTKQKSIVPNILFTLTIVVPIYLCKASITAAVTSIFTIASGSNFFQPSSSVDRNGTVELSIEPT